MAYAVHGETIILTSSCTGTKLSPMPTPKKPGAVRGRPKKAPVAEAERPVALTIRGFTPADHAALERATARREALVGGFVSQNTAVLSLLRAALAREDASGNVEVAPRSAT